MAKLAEKRVKVEKGADSEPAPSEAPAAAPVKEEKKPARPKTAAEVAHEAEMKARSDPYKGRALFGRQLDISTKNGVLGGSALGMYFGIDAGRYPRRGGQECIGASYTFGAGLPAAAGLDGVAPHDWRREGTRPLFVRRGGYPPEFRSDRYGPYDGMAPGSKAGKMTNGWEYCGDYRIEEDDIHDGVLFSSLPESERQQWLGYWATSGQADLVQQSKAWPNQFRLKQYRLVFVSYDEQLYTDLKAHQDARVAEM